MGNNVEGVLVIKTPWPSIARTVYQDHARYLETYMKVRKAPMITCFMSPTLLYFPQSYPGVFYTGDGAARDEHGYIWIKGRVDGMRHIPQDKANSH